MGGGDGRGVEPGQGITQPLPAGLLIRAEEARVLLGFWRGKRLTALEPRLETGGKYEMGRIVLRQGEAITDETVSRLAAQAYRLNHEVGDPTARR